MIVDKIKNILNYGLLNYNLRIKSLKPRFQEYDEIILHANFQILNDFVELDAASMAAACDISSGKLIESSRDLGLAYLDEYIKDQDSPDKSSQDWGKNCKKIKELYLWWNDERPKRQDPWENVINIDNLLGRINDHDNPEIKMWRKQGTKAAKQEEKYYKEDTKRLQELIKVRRFLWT